MKICLFLTLGRDTFGLGLDFEYFDTDWVFELQLGPLNIFTGYGWPLLVSFFGRRVYSS